MNNSPHIKRREVVIQGTSLSPGIASGSVFVFKPHTINLSELDLTSTDAGKEILYLDSACSKVHEQLSYAQEVSELNYKEEFSEIFESQKAFLKDPVLLSEIREEIQESGQTAAHAISKVLSGKSQHFINLENTYFRERAFDILDLKQKLIHALLGIDTDYQLSHPSIVVAEMLSPVDTVHFNRNFLLGFLTDKGGETSHSAIMARGLKIPAVVNDTNLSKIIQQNDYLIIDGFSGQIIINPTDKTKKSFIQNQKAHQKSIRQFKKLAHKKALTKDGKKIEILANVEFIHEISDAKINGAEGIGLYRTESLFIERGGATDEDTQFDIYRQMAEQVSPNSVVIRTIDLGGDKLIDGYGPGNEQNPVLGWRAIRFCLDNPLIFKTQLKAICRAGAYGNIKILLPMITSIEEIVQTKQIIKEVEYILDESGKEFKKNIELGIMVETPAVAVMADRFAKYVDFFSIGTNDLTQYALAIDRANNNVAHSFNTFHPTILKMIENSVQAAQENIIPVSLCGEFATIPEAIPLLLGMGLKSLSMNPFFIPEIKEILRSLNLEVCKSFYESVIMLDNPFEIKRQSRKFIEEHIPKFKSIT